VEEVLLPFDESTIETGTDGTGPAPGVGPSPTPIIGPDGRHLDPYDIPYETDE
jgi:hypothetical protein